MTHQTPRGRLYERPATEAARVAHEHITWAIRAGLTPADAVAIINPRLRPVRWDAAFGIVERAAGGMDGRRAA